MPERFQDLLGPNAPWLVGIVNVTPNSFADGGRFLDQADARRQALTLAAEGAAIVEFGGESTAPGTEPVPPEVELARIEGLVGELAGEMVVAVDTYRAATAEPCLALGARIINDVSALRADPDLARVVAEHGAFLVLMHAKDGPLPHATARAAHYRDVVEEVAAFLLRQAEVAVRAGVAAERIALDPGAGRFLSLDPADTWTVLREWERLTRRLRPFPVMVATSRKGFLGIPLPERDPISQFSATLAAARGASFIRTHDVRMARQFLEVARAMGVDFPAAG